MYETHLSSQTTNAGNSYEVPTGIEDTQFYALIYEFVNLARQKELTIRQAQILFTSCADYVLESNLK